MERNDSEISTQALDGQSVNVKVLQKNAGSIDMIRYTDDGWSNEGSWNEGVLGTDSGEWTILCRSKYKVSIRNEAVL